MRPQTLAIATVIAAKWQAAALTTKTCQITFW
jgi:hypothetical protein